VRVKVRVRAGVRARFRVRVRVRVRLRTDDYSTFNMLRMAGGNTARSRIVCPGVRPT
jgi:hypothetical protein